MDQVGDGIYRLGTAIHNFYVIEEGGKATVIDAGYSKELPKLEQGLASIGMKLEDVEAIILTHAHTDHIGFAAEAVPPARKSRSAGSRLRLPAATR